MTENQAPTRQPIALVMAFVAGLSVAAGAEAPEVEAFVAEASSAVVASFDVGDTTVVLLAHDESIDNNGAVYGDIYALAFRDGTDFIAWHRGSLHSNHAPGFASDAEWLFQVHNPETFKSELVYFNVVVDEFRIYPVPARFIGRMVIWDGTIFYSTEIYQENIHSVNLASGDIDYVKGSGYLFSNTDFWIIEGELVVTEYGDRGTPHFLDTTGLRSAPDVTVSEETKVGFNLRTIRGGEDLERFEELLGIR